MQLINGLSVLLLYQLVGESITRYFGLAIPGPVIGMLLLLLSLLLMRKAPEDLSTAANALLSHLSLLFVPAGVGVMVHFDLMRAEWLPIVAALLVSTLASLVLSGLVMKGVGRLIGTVEKVP